MFEAELMFAMCSTSRLALPLPSYKVPMPLFFLVVVQSTDVDISESPAIVREGHEKIAIVLEVKFE
jgi:hypothetical protein